MQEVTEEAIGSRHHVSRDNEGSEEAIKTARCVEDDNGKAGYGRACLGDMETVTRRQ